MLHESLCLPGSLAWLWMLCHPILWMLSQTQRLKLWGQILPSLTPAHLLVAISSLTEQPCWGFKKTSIDFIIRAHSFNLPLSLGDVDEVSTL